MDNVTNYSFCTERVKQYLVEIDHQLLCQKWRGIALSNMPDGGLDIDGFFKFRHEEDDTWWTISGGSCIVKVL